MKPPDCPQCQTPMKRLPPGVWQCGNKKCMNLTAYVRKTYKTGIGDTKRATSILPYNAAVVVQQREGSHCNTWANNRSNLVSCGPPSLTENREKATPNQASHSLRLFLSNCTTLPMSSAFAPERKALWSGELDASMRSPAAES